MFLKAQIFCWFTLTFAFSFMLVSIFRLILAFRFMPNFRFIFLLTSRHGWVIHSHKLTNCFKFSIPWIGFTLYFYWKYICWGLENFSIYFIWGKVFSDLQNYRLDCLRKPWILSFNLSVSFNPNKAPQCI